MDHVKKRKPIVKIENACPLCNSDVYGNEEADFLCRKCFVLFRKEHLNIKS